MLNNISYKLQSSDKLFETKIHKNINNPSQKNTSTFIKTLNDRLSKYYTTPSKTIKHN